jgi:hypothetical protein
MTTPRIEAPSSEAVLDFNTRNQTNWRFPVTSFGDRRRWVRLDIEAVQQDCTKKQSLELLGMEERVALALGSLSLESAQDGGTTLYVRIPISSQENGEVASWRN